MRTQTFISSCAVAALACAGSAANASVTLDFGTVDTTSAGWVQLSPSSYGGFAWGGDTEVMSAAYFNANYGSGAVTGNIAYNGCDLGAGVPISATWNSAGTISLESILLGPAWQSIGGSASTQVTFKGFKNGFEVASKVVDLTGSSQTVNFTGAFGDIDKFNMVSSAGGGYFYIDNITYAVPAPGAAALIGLAGLVATRRRRN